MSDLEQRLHALETTVQKQADVIGQLVAAVNQILGTKQVALSLGAVTQIRYTTSRANDADAKVHRHDHREVVTTPANPQRGNSGIGR